jgi:2,4-dienoyl-CoA reductase-like NADH-dependent reductase (Old Yellow Enzyme family)
MYSLRDEVRVKGLRLRNRIALPPLTTSKVNKGLPGSHGS